MKDYTVFIQLGVSFDSRSEVYDLLQHFRQFLDNHVPVDSFNLQDIKLGFHEMEKSDWR